MNIKYIGMDVHKETISIAVMNAERKLVMESIIETKASTILQFIQGLRGDLHVTFEEGTWAAWLYDLLKPHVTKLVVCDPRKNAVLKEGNKSDKIDARKLADLLRRRISALGLPWPEWATNLEGAGPQLSDPQQRSHPRHESSQGPVSKLGHWLCGAASLRAASSRPLVKPDWRSWGAPAGRVPLPTARCFASVASSRAAGSVQKAWKNDEAVFPPFPPTLEIDQADFHIPTVTTTKTR